MGIRLDHIGIAVNDLESGSSFWKLLGLTQGEDECNDDQGVNIRFFGTEPGTEATRIELLAPTGEDTPIGRFLEKKGAGIQQIAFRVDDLESLLARLNAEGVRLIDETPTQGANGSRIAFVHPSSTGGVLVELLEYDD
ncbi:MAG TPA: methylmalonyl-CoA epimerase [Candidatus Thalassarchaeaceae archaeon]|nr:methylmalonyl-CoA epimerase [Candidatus Thalassarchaeaceae archaeon]